MKDKLCFRRINWMVVLVNFHCENDFRKWKKLKNLKIKSKNKLAYLYLLNTKGREFISLIRKYPDFDNPEYLMKVVKTKWIVDYEL